ncbi:TPA: hypothetical protein ACG5BG_004793 [Pseudomonas aeruginosa]|uniref:hypothetical protein n=1 Tax=Pseudomonas aeruginosa TaxID=287 RepID=UPI00234EC208|nr:hypothetical protein [Pseudomonas aeruginosa]MDK8402338.1 hypothetical protein [Pseudomonas aeruginosa]MDK8442144.1 hypothetical protein [Pseudomonas aeruginosa]MDK8560271.1 hypothetical protein [Pseudomonas aeruginosa]MDV6779954.1 hypothetical protein [Pseudomonas aeruginosa]WCI73253.1 hypothetical protein PMJ87_34685 [Pseudomonas aeruginosa]
MEEFPDRSKSDNEPIALSVTADLKVRAAIKKIQEGAASYLYFLNNEGIPKGTAQDIASGLEFEMKKLGEALGISTEAAEVLEQRHGEIRRANLRIHELEGLLGSQQDPKAIQVALCALTKQLKGWWDLEGFGYVSEEAFGEYSLTVTFSCSTSLAGRHFEVTEPVSSHEREKLWEAYMKRRGFVFLENSEGDLHDCPQSRQALARLFATRLPSARIAQFLSYETSAGSAMRAVKVYIRDISEITSLPVPANTTE